ncbi:MAG: archaellin/type IV pilin N-terminal domain-containing protein [Haloferacaceae archaeon]
MNLNLDLDRSTVRAQVGIGTLIVFIAMVLVAAIAAGVLVNTAGFLQSSAQETGQKSSDQVTNRLEVVDAHGILDNNSAADRLATLNLTVRPASGSEDINLEEVTVKYQSENGEVETLTYAASAGATNFGVRSIQDTDGSLDSSPVVVNADSDRAQITISPADVTGGDSDGLPPSTSVTIEATTESGATTTISFTTPDSYSSGGNGDPIPLNV